VFKVFGFTIYIRVDLWFRTHAMYWQPTRACFSATIHKWAFLASKLGAKHDFELGQNSEMNLLLQENFKRSTESHKFDKIQPKKLQMEHKIDIQKLNETPNWLWKWIRNIETQFFHIELISNQTTVI
jgi:hypothetical protein